MLSPKSLNTAVNQFSIGAGIRNRKQYEAGAFSWNEN